ncbi:MAG: hypothetical protein V7L21_05800 [Nostoc sp.]|uniref:hypothetical protein n=1 Tax=unclassified Nostoc TaxID=2593658 RepID=UPI0025DB2A49|nr:hypothetical protein [Nostoc sp. NMS9]MBN3944144.1 hypothetical protein [Nostoc sp. NMS9]
MENIQSLSQYKVSQLIPTRTWKVIEWKLKENEFSVGIALDVEAETNVLLSVISHVDTVLIMGIKIGGRKLPLSENAIHSIRRVKKELALLNKNIEVGIDGGVNIYTFDML